MSQGRVLLVYREPLLADLARVVLRRSGFAVVSSAGSQTLDLVVTDDPEVAASHPATPAILISDQYDPPPPADVLAAPFTPAALMAMVAARLPGRIGAAAPTGTAVDGDAAAFDGLSPSLPPPSETRDGPGGVEP